VETLVIEKVGVTCGTDLVSHIDRGGGDVSIIHRNLRSTSLRTVK